MGKLRCPRNSHRGPSFEVARCKQRHFRKPLHPIEKRGHGIRLRIANGSCSYAIDYNETSDVQIAHKMNELTKILEREEGSSP